MNIGYCLQGYPVKSQTWIPLEIEELEKRGHKVNVIDIEKPLNQKEIKECEFIICHFAFQGLYASRWGIPYGVIPHAYDIFKDNGTTLKKVSEYKNCKFIGCVSEFHKEKYIEWGINKPLKYTFVCCNVDTLYKKKENLGEKIITGGRDKEKKGFKYAAEGFPTIHMFGSESLNSYKSISNRITCYNWPSIKKLRNLLDESWLFVAPFVIASNGDMDSPLCTTVKEALLMELQVLTTDIWGNKEFKYVHYTTKEDIAKGYNGEVYKQIIKERNTSGRQYVIDTFSPKVCINKYLSAIESVL